MQAVEERGAVGNLGSMQFIDFEYGAYSYRGHDWGNHFAEYAGFECDYSRYPDNEHVELFVRAYLNEKAHTPAVSVSRTHSHCAASVGALRPKGTSGSEGLIPVCGA